MANSKKILEVKKKVNTISGKAKNLSIAGKVKILAILKQLAKFKSLDLNFVKANKAFRSYFLSFKAQKTFIYL